jgi:hypothetical protein
MSLDWNATRISGFKEKVKDEAWQGNMANLCFTLMAIGMGSVTEKNVGEVYTRIQILEATYGPLRYHYDEETRTKSSVYDFDFLLSVIGYGTNVSNETLNQWTKRFLGNRITEAQERFTKRLES